MSRVDDQYKHTIRNAEKRNKLKIALIAISLAVVFGVFASLTRTGITMTAQSAENVIHQLNEPTETTQTAGTTEHLVWTLEDNTLTLAYYNNAETYTADDLSAISTALGSQSFTTLKCTGNLAIFPNSTIFSNKVSTYDYSACTDLTTIPDSAFLSDTTVTTVILPTTMTTISSNAFNGCTSLSSLTASSALTNVTIGENAFANCSALTDSIWNTIDKTTAVINNSAFTNAGVTYPETEEEELVPASETEETEPETASEEPSDEEEGIAPQSDEETTADAFSIDSTTGQVTIIDNPTAVSTYTSGNATGYLYQNTDGTQVLCIKQTAANTNYTSSEVKAIYTELGLTSSTCSAIKFYGNTSSDGTYYGLKTADDSLKSTTAIFDFSECASVEKIADSAFKNDTTIKKIIFAADSQFNDFAHDGLNGTTLDKITVVGGQGLQNLTKLSQSAFGVLKGTDNFDWNFLCPEKITEIGEAAFFNCHVSKKLDLSQFKMLETIGKSAFQNANVLDEVVLVDMQYLKTIGNSAFYANDNGAYQYCITKVVIKNNPALVSIGDEALERLKGVSKIEITNNPQLTTLRSKVMHSCDNVKEVDLSNNANLTTLASDSLQSFGYNYNDNRNNGSIKVDLSGCTSLKTLPSGGILSDNNRTRVLGEIDLSNTGITEIPDNYFGSGVTGRSNGQYAYLSKVDLSDCKDLTTIGANAFANDTKLTSINLTGDTALKTIGDSAFYKCENLKEIDLSAATSLGANAFNGCTALESIKINSDLKTVGADAFTDAATNGATLTIGKDVGSICADAFKTLNIKSVIFEGSATAEGRIITLGEGAFADCVPLSDMCENGTNKYWVDQDGNVYSEDQKTLYYISPTVTDYTLPDTVTTVASNAAKMATSLKSITIGTDTELKEIKTSAFANCETLEKVIIKGIEYKDVTDVEKALSDNISGIKKGQQIFNYTGLTDKSNWRFCTLGG